MITLLLVGCAYGQDQKPEYTEQRGARNEPSVAQSNEPASERPELVVQSGHSGSITALSFSKHRYLATASVDGTVKIWQVATGQLMRTLVISEYWVYSVAFSPDERRLASGSGDDIVRLWDVDSGRLLKEFMGHAHAVKRVAFYPGGNILTSESDSYPADPEGSSRCFWDVESGKRLNDNNLPWPANTSLEFNGTITAVNGRWKAVARGSSFRILGDPERSAGQESPPPIAVRAIAFSSDGKTMGIGRADGKIMVWNLTSGLPSRWFENQPAGPTGVIHSIGFTPNADSVFGAAWDSSMWLWRRASAGPPQVLHRPVPGLQPESALGTPRTRPELKPPPGPPSPPMGLTASVDGAPVPVTEEVYAAAISPNPNNHLLAYGGYSYDDRIKSNFLTVIDWDSQQVVDYVLDLPEAGHTRALSFSVDGYTLAVGYEDGTLGLRDVRNRKFVYLLKAHARSIRAVAISPDGNLVASAGEDEIVKLWDAKKGTLLASLKGHTAPVLALAFSADSANLVSGGLDDKIIVWNGGNQLQTIQGHSAAVNALAYVPHADLLVSGSEDGTVRFWSSSNYKLLASAAAFDKNDWLVFTPDGFFDGTPQAWQFVPFRFPSEPEHLYEPEQFFNQFYQPGLLSDVVGSGKSLAEFLRDQEDPRSAVDISSYRNSSLPKVRITGPLADGVSSQRTIELKVEAEDTGSGLGDLRVFRNQSLIHYEHGKLNADPVSKTYQVTFSAKLSAGENHISAYVFNRDNIKSKDANLTIRGSDSLRRKGTVYLLAIGVNKYANSGFNLHYANADAQTVVEALSHSLMQIGSYDRVVPLLLLDEHATKNNILAALQRLGNNHVPNIQDIVDMQKFQPAEPEDAVIIYFAGHGMARNDRYYLIPHDLGYDGSPMQIDTVGRHKIMASSVDDQDLQRVLEKIDTPRILLIVDACQSGQILESAENRRGPMNSRGIAQLAYEKGAYILAAAQSFQAALEFQKLGHGILTYVLVEEGLRQHAADLDPADAEVTVREWLEYATHQVPVEAESDQHLVSKTGRSVEFKEEPAAGQAPRSYFRSDTGENWILDNIAGPASNKPH